MTTIIMKNGLELQRYTKITSAYSMHFLATENENSCF